MKVRVKSKAAIRKWFSDRGVYNHDGAYDWEFGEICWCARDGASDRMDGLCDTVVEVLPLDYEPEYSYEVQEGALWHLNKDWVEVVDEEIDDIIESVCSHDPKREITEEHIIRMLDGTEYNITRGTINGESVDEMKARLNLLRRQLDTFNRRKAKYGGRS